jgi:hypothetical protein
MKINFGGQNFKKPSPRVFNFTGEVDFRKISLQNPSPFRFHLKNVMPKSRECLLRLNLHFKNLTGLIIYYEITSTTL